MRAIPALQDVRPDPGGTVTTTYHSSLSTLAESPAASGVWWSSVARALDDLAARLEAEAAVDAGPDGALKRAVDDEPTLAARANSVNAERMALQVRVHELRGIVSAHAGDREHVDMVAKELALLSEGEINYQRKVRAVVWDSLTRDIGGE
jgi:hypothetical protein